MSNTKRVRLVENSNQQNLKCKPVSHHVSVTFSEVQFVIEKLGLKAGAQLLDVPCGNGRHAIELAKKGFNVTGIDINEQYIEQAKQVSNKISAGSLTFVTDDMRQIKAISLFDAAYCLGDSFGYFGADACELFVKGIARALKPGGKFLIDSSSVAEVLIPNLKKNAVFCLDGRITEVNNTYHADSSCLETMIRTTTGQKVHNERSLKWIFTVGELTRMLGRHGLLVDQLYGSIEGDNFELGSPRLLTVVQKQKP